ncbi:regulatory protein RecX [Eubacteriales bacterium KG127]
MSKKKKIESTAYGEGAKYLSRQMRTAYQVMMHLKGCGFSDEDVEKAVCQLENENYINDGEYAFVFLRKEFRKGRSINRVKRELEILGASSINIEDALYRIENAGYDELGEFIEVSEVDRSRKEMLKILQNMGLDETDSISDRVYNKIVRKLVSQGYSGFTIKRCVRNLIREF